MKHGILTIYIIDFLNRGIQDRHREYTRDLCRNTHFRDQLNIFPCLYVSLTWYDDYTIIQIINHHQNVFFIIIYKTIHAQSQWPSSRHLKYYN